MSLPKPFLIFAKALAALLLLAESGHVDKLNPRWLQRALSAQLDDGGWADFSPIVSMRGSTLGFTAKGLALREPVASFHATAQGVWLTALLANDPAAAE